MKTAMKKLLSLMLVAVLLVSTVPFKASAANGDKDVPVKIYVDGAYARDGSITVPVDGSVTLTETLALSLVNSDKDFVEWRGNSGNNATGATITYDKIPDTGYYVELYVTLKTRQDKVVPVKIYVDGAYARDGSITVPVDGSVTLTETLALSLVNDDKDFVEWKGSSGNNATGATITYDKIPATGYYVNLYVKVKTTTSPITVKIVDNNGAAIANQFEITPVNGTSAVVENILTSRWNNNWKDSYEFVSATSASNGSVALSGSVNAGDTVTITLKKTATTPTTTEPENNNTTNKFPYNVYLHIFKDNKVDDPAKTINITSGIALDGKVTLDEVKSLVKEYYTAKTSDGIGYDGMYLAVGNWVGNFVYDTQKYSTIEDTNEMRQIREVHINVMITNATAKSTTSTSTADTTNPKTGDSIYMVVTVMGLSAAALAAVYYVSKKRAF